MRPKNVNFLAMLIGLNLISACSSTTEVVEAPVIPEVPEYVKVPHPVNFELASLRAIFYSPLAPQDIQGEFADSCDHEFQKLAQISNSIEERHKAAVELVSGDPERVHWCFYVKVSKLQDSLQSDTTWSQRQKKVFETFTYLSPVSNAFLEVFHDSRYLRWATQYYSKISEWVFFRKVSPAPESTLAIIKGAAPSELEPWVPVDAKISKRESVFTKYGISLAPTVASGTNPLDQAERIPASIEKPKTSVKPIETDPSLAPPSEGVVAQPLKPVEPAKPHEDPTVGY